MAWANGQRIIPMTVTNTIDNSMERLKQVRYIAAFGIMVSVLLWSQVGFGNILASEKYSRIVWRYLETLCDFGPRNPGSEGYLKTINLIRKVGEKYADEVVEHPFLVRTAKGTSQPMMNLELKFQGTQGGAPILIGAHFDTRPFADEDPDPENRSTPILGANDGGSGTAVLLGLAQYLNQLDFSFTISVVGESKAA